MTKPKPTEDHGALEAIRTIGHARSGHWPTVEKAFRKVHPQCVACLVKSVAHVQIHHIYPYHYCIALGRPDLELDPRNLITLCEWPSHSSPDHHLLCGHLGNFQAGNLDVAADVHVFRGMSEVEIRKDPRWIKEVATRLAPLDKMTAADKKAFTTRMNATFPKK